MQKQSAKFKLAILCGGPSLERGISLNSARSVMDHLESDEIEVLPVYFDTLKHPYAISKAQLYSNTPSDFDFKLKQTATPLTERALVQLLRTADIVFPVMHGPFGEDGEIQSFLEKNSVPFVGSGSRACKRAFDKFIANDYIREHGFDGLASTVLKIYHKNHRETIESFFKQHNVKRAIVKPASGGSSIGVFSVSNAREALEKAELLFSKRMDTRVVVEPFADGTEFTMIMLQNRFGLPIALPPTEIETDYTEHQIFDFRKKYLPTHQVVSHCPPRFENATIEKIQAQGEELFALFGMRDVARFDGWVLRDGGIWFSDFNPISGMEQNSFLFQQAARIGMTHEDILRHIVARACARFGISFPEHRRAFPARRKKVHILMGGANSERQVSLMSGTNVWLKLRHSKLYEPHPFLLDTKGSVWRIPYHLALNHTVEEIAHNCERYNAAKAKLLQFERRARLRLGLEEHNKSGEFFEPQKLTLHRFVRESRFVFIALHGGNGENGTLQKLLRERNISFNGPEANASRLCMDKWDTSQFIRELGLKGIDSITGTLRETKKILKMSDFELKTFWKTARKEFRTRTLIVKPRADGCSSGVVRLYSLNDLKKYLTYVRRKAPSIPRQTFRGQRDIIEMPTETPEGLLFEKFVETDVVHVRANELQHRRRTGWIEVTVGVVEMKGMLRALNPSITVAEGEVLSVEEKFQGGTGVNITPPPAQLMKPKTLRLLQQRIKEVATKIGLRGYSRIDAFVNVVGGDVLVIEVNTLPGLTPSTVLYHQALAEHPQIFPQELLETLIRNKGY